MGARSGYFEEHQSVDWQKAYDEHLKEADRVLKPQTADAAMAK